MRVEEIMTLGPVTVDIQRSIRDALAIAREAELHHLLLTADEALVGVACVCELELRDGTAVLAQALPDELLTIEADCSLEHAALRFVETGVGCLPVMQDQRLIGVLTRGDLGRAKLPEGALPMSLRCSFCGDTRHVRARSGQPELWACLECEKRSEAGAQYEQGGRG